MTWFCTSSPGKVGREDLGVTRRRIVEVALMDPGQAHKLGWIDGVFLVADHQLPRMLVAGKIDGVPASGQHRG